MGDIVWNLGLPEFAPRWPASRNVVAHVDVAAAIVNVQLGPLI